MAGQKFVTLITLALSLPSLAHTAPAEQRGPPTSSNGTPQFIVWIRAASDQDMRLSPKTAPALRYLARKGVSYPALEPATHASLTAAMRAIGEKLGSHYVEVALGAPSVERPLDRLISDLGQPPPVSAEDRKAFERLRAASKDRERADDPIPRRRSPDDTKRTAPEPSAPPANRPDRDVMQALSKGKRLIAVIDPFPAGKDNTSIERDRVLSRIALAVFSGLGSRDQASARSYLIVVLLPENGSPALIAAGHYLKRGRVDRRALSADDITAGLTRWLSLARPDTARGTSDWLSRAHYADAVDKKGGAR